MSSSVTRYIIFLIILCISNILQAQTIWPLALTYHRKLHGINELPFNRVIVIDNRFDTSKIEIVEDGTYPIKVTEFSQPASIVIKTYIETVIHNLKKEDRLLYVSIKQLRYRNVNQNFIFSADAYFKINNHFEKIASIKNDDYRTHGYQKTISKALNDLIKIINENYYKKNTGENKINEVVDSINTSVMLEWKDFPIIRQDTFPNGIYETFSDFKYNKIKTVDFAIQLNPNDSISSVNFPDNSRYYNRRDNQYHHVFAICYNNNMYVQISGKFFLRLNKLNNTYYFYVPQLLPNMYAIISEKLLIAPYVYNNQMTYSTNPYLALVGGIIGIEQQKKVNNETRDQKKNIIEQGLLSSDMRTCFFDMDNGDIIYY